MRIEFRHGKYKVSVFETLRQSDWRREYDVMISVAGVCCYLIRPFYEAKPGFCEPGDDYVRYAGRKFFAPLRYVREADRNVIVSILREAARRIVEYAALPTARGSITAFHGVAAYSGPRNPFALLCKVKRALSGVQICCADRPIGAVGIIATGECIAAFSRDVWSATTEFGLRYATTYEEYESIVPADQSEYEDFCRRFVSPEHPRHYGEAWIESNVLRAVWVKDWADDAIKETAEIIAHYRRVPLIVVDGTTRIWDVLDNHRLPFAYGIGKVA